MYKEEEVLSHPEMVTEVKELWQLVLDVLLDLEIKELQVIGCEIPWGTVGSFEAVNSDSLYLAITINENVFLIPLKN